MLDDAPYPRLPYLLSTIRIGVICTFIIMAPIALYPFAGPDDALTHPSLYWATVVVGLAGAGIVAVLPWERMFARGWGYPGLYLWSIGDITLISLLVFASGGAPSPLWSIFALTTIFFAASYPRPSQYGLFAFTVIAYLVGITAVDPAHLTAEAGLLVLRLGLLATVAIMAGFISAELFRHMEAQERRARASRRIADAAAQISTLERQKVMDTAVRAAEDIGFPISAVVMLEGQTYRVVASAGLPESFDRLGLADGSTPVGEVWAMPRDEIADPQVAALLEDRGCPTMIMAPLQVGRGTVGVFVACGEGDPTDVESIQMLGTVVSSALENAELYRLKTDFVANVSHELRTPLTVLAGLGETMRRRARQLPPDSIEELAERMEANAERLHAMITALLDFSELESREQRASREQIDVTALVEAAIDARRDRIDPREIAFSSSHPEATAPGDAEMLRRVIDNLLDNIADHTPPQTRAEITVGADAETVTVTVADDGPGLPAAEAGRATQRFYRGGDHRTRRTGGLGLGLALAQEIVALHGGELKIDDREGGGTTVSFRLPRAR